MRSFQSDYMHWAKFKPPVEFALTTSEVPHFRMDSLGVTIEDLDMDGASHPRYAPLRQRIARQYRVPVENVVAADGTSMANFLAMATLISPGDEVLIEKPTYGPLLDAASFLGAKINRFQRKASEAFRLDPCRIEEALGKETRLIVLTNLHNPSGVLAGNSELQQIGELAAAHGARVLVDEIYLDSVGDLASAIHLGLPFVTTNSLTKVYGLSGLRCGWILAEPELAERMWRLNDLFGVNQAHQAERLGCIAFDNLKIIIGDNPAMLQRNRALFDRFVAGRADLDCATAECGITAFPRWTGGDTQCLDDRLREKYDASIVPGRWFEMPEHFRIGFGLETPLFEEGLSRLGAALDDLR